MPIPLEELRRLTDTDGQTRGIAGYLYCEKCAYCLRTLPRVGYCPECGNLYDSRINSMKGIFTGREFDIPFGSALGAIVMISFTVYAAIGWWATMEPRSAVVTVASAVAGLWYLYETYRMLRDYIVARITVNRIEQSREE